ncbi:MAG: hypothetical protein WA791_21390 [Rhodomicrobium sp.]
MAIATASRADERAFPGAFPFVQHAWAVHDADDAMEFNGEYGISVSDFLSKEYPEDAKMSLRWLLTSKPSG